MRVEADASEYTTGVLLMRCEDNKWRPVAFISKLLNKAERNYEIHNQEMLAIIRCLEEWRYLLEKTQNKFKIWSDHKNLKYFMFTLKHVPGSSIGKANSLNRHPNWQVGVKKDNEDRVLVKKKQLEIRAAQVAEIIIEKVDLLKKIQKSDAKDNKVIKAVEEMK